MDGCARARRAALRSWAGEMDRRSADLAGARYIPHIDPRAALTGDAEGWRPARRRSQPFLLKQHHPCYPGTSMVYRAHGIRAAAMMMMMMMMIIIVIMNARDVMMRSSICSACVRVPSLCRRDGGGDGLAAPGGAAAAAAARARARVRGWGVDGRGWRRSIFRPVAECAAVGAHTAAWAPVPQMLALGRRRRQPAQVAVHVPRRAPPRARTRAPRLAVARAAHQAAQLAACPTRPLAPPPCSSAHGGGAAPLMTTSTAAAAVTAATTTTTTKTTPRR
eukprot:scaffold1044_cov332-Prasinococcus_capsulatus_cf.AAC.5